MSNFPLRCHRNRSHSLKTINQKEKLFSFLTHKKHSEDDDGSMNLLVFPLGFKPLKQSPRLELQRRYSLYFWAFCVTAAINLSSLGESWSHLWRSEVKRPSTALPATCGGRLFGRLLSPWRPVCSSGGVAPDASVRPHRATQQPGINHFQRKTMGPYVGLP